jgi:hypothetical protein
MTSRPEADAGAAIPTALTDARNTAASRSGTRQDADRSVPGSCRTQNDERPAQRSAAAAAVRTASSTSRPLTTLNTVRAAISATAT